MTKISVTIYIVFSYTPIRCSFLIYNPISHFLYLSAPSPVTALTLQWLSQALSYVVPQLPVVDSADAPTDYHRLG